MFGAFVGKVFQQGKARQRYFLVGFAECPVLKKVYRKE